MKKSLAVLGMFCLALSFSACSDGKKRITSPSVEYTRIIHDLQLNGAPLDYDEKSSNPMVDGWTYRVHFQENAVYNVDSVMVKKLSDDADVTSEYTVDKFKWNVIGVVTVTYDSVTGKPIITTGNKAGNAYITISVPSEPGVFPLTIECIISS